MKDGDGMSKGVSNVIWIIVAVVLMLIVIVIGILFAGRSQDILNAQTAQSDLRACCENFKLSNCDAATNCPTSSGTKSASQLAAIIGIKDTDIKQFCLLTPDCK
jgi:hypothetical protein